MWYWYHSVTAAMVYGNKKIYPKSSILYSWSKIGNVVQIIWYLHHATLLDVGHKQNEYISYYGAKNIDTNRGNLVGNSLKFPVNNEHNIIWLTFKRWIKKMKINASQFPWPCLFTCMEEITVVQTVGTARKCQEWLS